MLLYLTSWKERGQGEQYPCSWKSYGFDILNALTESDLVIGSHKSKSVYLTEEGVSEAKRLLASYGIAEKSEEII